MTITSETVPYATSVEQSTATAEAQRWPFLGRESERVYYRAYVQAQQGRADDMEDGSKRAQEPLLLTIDEAAQTLRISKWKLYEYIHNRQLQTVKFGSRRLVPATALRALVDQLGEQEAL